MLEPIIHGLILSFGLILPIGVQNAFIFNQGVLQPTFLRILPAIITVSWVWFFGLGLLGRFSKELDKSGLFLTWLNKISAVFMWLAAILLVLSFL